MDIVDSEDSDREEGDDRGKSDPEQPTVPGTFSDDVRARLGQGILRQF